MNYNDYELLDLIEDNDEIAYEIMLSKYKPLIFSKARAYYNYLITNFYVETSLDDFICEGYLAFDRAIRNFDKYKGYLFYSFLSSCLISCFNLLVRNNKSLKNRPLLHYQELDFEINDSSQVNPYDYIDITSFYEKLKKYLLDIDFFDSAILELRLNNFKYREISELLNTNSTRINRVINKFREKFNIK